MRFCLNSWDIFGTWEWCIGNAHWTVWGRLAQETFAVRGHSLRHTAQRLDSATPLTAPDVLLEYAMNALRLDAGFTVDDFRAATGLALSVAAGPLDASIARGLIERKEDVIRCTALGRRYLDELLQHWLVEEPGDARSSRG